MKSESCIQLRFNSFDLTPRFPQYQILVFLLFGQPIGRNPKKIICEVNYIFDKVFNNTKIAQIQLCMCQKWIFVCAKHFCRGQY
jgi:hypothetical protein